MTEIKIVFQRNKTKKAFDKLKKTDRKMFKFVKRAFDDIQQDYTVGSKIPLNRVSKQYIQKWELNHTRNLWKYDLPSAWRLLYTITGDKIIMLAIILDWFDHKNYEKIYQ